MTMQEHSVYQCVRKSGTNVFVDPPKHLITGGHGWQSEVNPLLVISAGQIISQPKSSFSFSATHWVLQQNKAWSFQLLSKGDNLLLQFERRFIKNLPKTLHIHFLRRPI